MTAKKNKNKNYHLVLIEVLCKACESSSFNTIIFALANVYFLLFSITVFYQVY